MAIELLKPNKINKLNKKMRRKENFIDKNIRK